MNIQPDSIQSIAGDDELVLDFFVDFSRFECALKRAGFVKPGSSGSASPDWNRFAAMLSAKLSLITDAEFTHAKRFLLLEPPRKQMFVAPRSMRWDANSKRSGESETQYLLRLVRDVRNNLFHGGKYPDGVTTDDGDLSSAAIAVFIA